MFMVQEHYQQHHQAVTFTETGANTGIFTNWDDSLKTNMYINAAADRGTQATFKWDDVEYSVLYMPFWGTISFNTEGTQVEIGTILVLNGTLVNL